MEAQQRWFDAHKTLHITNDAHSAILRFAGKLQLERGEFVSISAAIEELARRALEDI